MKLNKKKVFTLALAVCLIAILSMNSLAWFTDNDSVKNDFFIADSDDDTADEIFSVDVYENYDSNGDGTDEEYQSGIIYEDILPGDELQKEAYVKNTGYYDQFIRVTVTLSDATAWINALGVDFVIEDCLVGFDETMWSHIEKTIEGQTDTITYVLYYKGILDGADEDEATATDPNQITVFEGLKIPETLTREQAVAFGGGFDINIFAEAVQTENLGTNAYDAFAALN